MRRDCAKFVRGCTFAIRAEQWGGASENVRAQLSRNFRAIFKSFTETKLYGQKMSQPLDSWSAPENGGVQGWLTTKGWVFQKAAKVANRALVIVL